MPPVIKIPRRFWQDCVDCDCDVPRSYGPNRRHCVWIEAEHPHLPELIARAEMYADLRNHTPSVPQGALWAELWRSEGTNTSWMPGCESHAQLHQDLTARSDGLRLAYREAVV